MTDALKLPGLAILTKEQLRQVVNDALDAVVVMNDKGLLVDWNNQAEVIFGWTRQEVVGQPMANVIIPPRHRAAHRQGLERYLTTGEGPVLRQRIEITALRKNGDEFPIELTISPVHLEKGVIFSAFVRDITEFRQLQNQRAIEDRLRQLSQAVEQSASSIIITDTQGVIEYLNPVAEKTTGYSREEVLGQHTRILKSGDTSPEEYKQLWETISAGRVWAGEFHNKRKDGTLYWELATISPIKDDTGKITHYLAVKEDITHRKKAEAEHKKLLADAETRSKELLILNELSQSLTTRLSVNEVLAEAHKQASRLVDATHFFIGLYDKDKHQITFPVYESDVDRDITCISANQGLSGYIIRNKTGVLLKDNVKARQEAMGIEMVGQQPESWLGVPMMIGNEVLGVIAVQNFNTSHRYDEHDQELLTAVANQVAIVLQNIHQFEEIQRTAHREQVLRKVTTIINSGKNVTTVLSTISRYLRELIPIDLLTLAAYTPGDSEFELFAVDAGEEGHFAPKGIRLPVEGTAPGWVITHNDIWLDEDFRESKPFMEDAQLIAEGMVSRLLLPLRIGEKIIGTFNLGSSQPGAFNEDHLPLLWQVADQMVTAMERSRLFEEAQRRADHERVIREITEKMRAATSLEQLVKITAVELGNHLSAGHAVLELGFEKDPSRTAGGAEKVGNTSQLGAFLYTPRIKPEGVTGE